METRKYQPCRFLHTGTFLQASHCRAPSLRSRSWSPANEQCEDPTCNLPTAQVSPANKCLAEGVLIMPFLAYTRDTSVIVCIHVAYQLSLPRHLAALGRHPFYISSRCKTVRDGCCSLSCNDHNLIHFLPCKRSPLFFAIFVDHHIYRSELIKFSFYRTHYNADNCLSDGCSV